MNDYESSFECDSSMEECRVQCASFWFINPAPGLGKLVMIALSINALSLQFGKSMCNLQDLLSENSSWVSVNFSARFC